MWKKTLIGLGLGALVLSGCNMRDDEPGVDETPMEDVREETRDVVPGTSPTTEDQNRDEDKDMTEDRNTPEEEILEDDMDARDADDMDR
ncbi:hypothetical protein [Paenisporosarcina antarctica]|uniref:Uncharacterized protein n=1 Tax=Paenisporosarcina antarctica TaxID=417367 RepID=A0A4V1ANA3_9BACL|nr:hypothetical protein [Paenisporosarcina antarctica]QBP42075.1 hypothetical protein E2636_13370 [Paenisporosarcina antarctica]